MSNLPNCSSNHFADGHSHDDDDDDDDDSDYDIPLKSLKMRKPPNKTEKGIVMNGLRCILYGELINGPFILFPSAQNSHINMICVYNEYFVENKMHHINLLDLNCVLIHKEKSILMVLMAAEVYEKVVNHRGDISGSLSAGTSHVLEFLIDTEHDRETMVEEMKSLLIDICRVCHYPDTSDASSKKSLYVRLCPEVFLIWREVRTKDFSNATRNIDLVSRMHVYLRDKVHSTFDEIKLFFYPIRGNIHLKSKKVLMGMNHIESKRDIIAFDANSYTKGVEGQILQRLMQDASLDDRLIFFWFQW